MKLKILTVRASKNGNLKAIPLSDGALIRRSKIQHISARAYPLTVHTLKDALDRAVIEAGMKNFRVHDFRHTPAMRLVQAGEDLYRVKELMGHKFDQEDRTVFSPLSRKPSIIGS